MDPEVALARAQACAQQLATLPDAVEHLVAYVEWRQKGGFQPVNGDARWLMAYNMMTASLLSNFVLVLRERWTAAENSTAKEG